MSDTPQNEGAQAASRQFQIQKIYVKDLSFESPKVPGIFTTSDFGPEVSVQLNNQIEKLDDTAYEVVLTVTATAKQNDDTVYLVEVQQAGIFAAAGFPEEEMGPMLGAFCPNILFPYARETISDLVTRGGFPQLLLAPVNFDALYQQQQAQSQQQASATH